MATRHEAAARDVAFVFDAAGVRRAGSPDADAIIGSHAIEHIEDFATRFRQPDGLPLDVSKAGSRLAVGMNGATGRRFTITTQRLESGLPATVDAAPGPFPATLILVSQLGAEDDPVTLQQALGSILAHELRTPMTTIFGGAQLVANESVSTATKTEAARSVARETERLHRVVEDLVVLVRSSADVQDDLEPVLLQHLLPAMIDMHRRLRPEVTIEASLPPRLPAVLASEDKVSQVLRNVLEQAILYTHPGGRIVIDAQRVGKDVEVRVTDDGLGRDVNDAAAAFDLFHRSPRTAADPSGANLALAVSRRLVEAMGGRMSAVSREAGGEIVFALPVAGSKRGSRDEAVAQG
ncbi:MAG TPA: ATP-binding protein [Candidatus Limnocylindrales bacterium]